MGGEERGERFDSEEVLATLHHQALWKVVVLVGKLSHCTNRYVRAYLMPKGFKSGIVDSGTRPNT